MTKLGICMDGGEERFLEVIEGVARSRESGFTYVEIGLAYGETLKGVWDRIRSYPGATVFGFELPTWEGIDCIRRRFYDGPLVENKEGLEGAVNIILKPSTEGLKDWTRPIDVAFIDGCHGKACAMADFLALAPHITPGGLVIFHDAGEAEQGGDIQKHCGTPIGVREAIEELGLWGDRIRYHGVDWEFEEMIPSQNQAAAFRKL